MWVSISGSRLLAENYRTVINNLYTAIATTTTIAADDDDDSMHSVIAFTADLPTNCSVTYLEENEP